MESSKAAEATKALLRRDKDRESSASDQERGGVKPVKIHLLDEMPDKSGSQSSEARNSSSMDVLQPSLEALQRAGDSMADGAEPVEPFVGKSSTSRIEVGGQEARTVAKLLRRVFKAQERRVRAFTFLAEAMREVVEAAQRADSALSDVDSASEAPGAVKREALVKAGAEAQTALAHACSKYQASSQRVLLDFNEVTTAVRGAQAALRQVAKEGEGEGVDGGGTGGGAAPMEDGDAAGAGPAASGGEGKSKGTEEEGGGDSSFARATASSLAAGIDELQEREKEHLRVTAQLHALKQQQAMGAVGANGAGAGSSLGPGLGGRVRALEAERSSVRARVEEALDELRSEGAEVLMAFEGDEDEGEGEDEGEDEDGGMGGSSLGAAVSGTQGGKGARAAGGAASGAGDGSEPMQS